ncbi:MAG: hypothetical protein RLZZ380_465 [Actinomycetota bacterium]|jgi:ComF family protein
MSYTPDAKLLLRSFKELGESSLAYPIAQTMTSLLGCFEQVPTRLVPIPSNSRSIRERGFNPAEIIAREIAKQVPSLRFENLLARARQTLDQSKLNPSERRDNQQGSMVARVGTEQVLLIDDVVTTGATLKEATQALEEAGHSVIGFLTFAETEAKRCNLTTQATLPADGGTTWNSKFPQKI